MRVKICCIKNLDEAELAVKAGATEIGLVGAMPSGPGIITDNEIRIISERFNDQVNTVVLTSEESPRSILRHIKSVGTRAAQIVREIPIASLEEIKNLLPDIKIFQVVHVDDSNAISRAVEYSEFADIILLDSGNPGQSILGGTGKAHDWHISKQIVNSVGVPVFLAGGLNPENVVSAINNVGPDGVDVCSGLRSEGQLSKEKVKMFFKKISMHV